MVWNWWKRRKDNAPRDDREAVLKINLDEWSEDEKQEFYAKASGYTQWELHTGHVSHGYAIDQVPGPDACPRCQATTQQAYANFIYATDTTPRVMFSPAGYFCTACPTVVIDERRIQEGVSGPFVYRGVLGIDHQDKPTPDLFKTWNGSRTIYIFDESENPIGLATHAQMSPKDSIRPKRSSDRRRQMSKVSRKQNRRKR